MTDTHVKDRGVVVATVGLGSNLGDREAAISDAIRRIADRAGNRLVAESSLYETAPFGKEDQGWFLNSVIRVETSCGMNDFFRFLQEVEVLWGRRREERWGPRTLDLDLLLFGEAVSSEEDLAVPHPGIAERRFVLEPLCEIAPEIIHPTLRKSFRELLDRLKDPCRVIRLNRVAAGRTVFASKR
jgi:2-amino-4-hydroxy-6-hydroxymethyldihydropteridine diphosphokinase